MPLHTLYSISEAKWENGEYTALVSFNPGHEVFKGHFPGQPIVPGVVLLRVIREMASMIKGKPATAISITNIKFLQLVDPEKTCQARLSGTYAETADGEFSLQASLTSEEVVFMRFRGYFA